MTSMMPPSVYVTRTYGDDLTRLGGRLESTDFDKVNVKFEKLDDYLFASQALNDAVGGAQLTFVAPDVRHGMNMPNPGALVEPDAYVARINDARLSGVDKAIAIPPFNSHPGAVAILTSDAAANARLSSLLLPKVGVTRVLIEKNQEVRPAI